MNTERIRNILRFSRYLLPYWDKQASLYIAMVFSVLFGLVNPYLARLGIDYALLAGDVYIFNMLLLVGVVGYLFSIPIETGLKFRSFYLRTRVSLDLRSEYYRRLQRLSLRFYESKPVGEHLYRIGPDVEGVIGLIIDTVPSALVFVFRFVLLLGICLYFSWKATIAVLLFAPLFYWHTHYFTKRHYRVQKDLTEKNQDISANLEQAFSRSKLIRIFGAHRREYRRYLRDVFQAVRLNVKNMKIGIWRAESGRLLNAALTGGVAYYLGLQVIRGRLTLGQMTALSMYLFQLVGAVKSVGGIYRDVTLRCISMERLLQTFEAPVEVQEAPRPIRVKNPRGSWQVRGLTFGYDAAKPVLSGIDMAIEPSGTIAVTGPSGSGKSTLCYLLLRLYDPTGGEIRFDGQDIRQLKINDYRRCIGYAGHEPLLLKATVADNCRFADPRATDEQVVEAAKIAGADEFIRKLQNGYDTVVGRGACGLSQGQMQRIALARTVLAKPRVFILDEALSGVDQKDEVRILGNLRRRFPSAAVVLVSHRLSLLRYADEVFFLNNGVVEYGGPYAKLAGAAENA